MKITDISGQRVKIGKTSITVKDANDKTRGIVNCVTVFKNAAPREQFNYYSRLRKIENIEHDKVIICDGELYYLHNLKPIEFYEKYIAGNECDAYKHDTKRYIERKQIAEDAAQYMIVIPCYILA